MIGSSHQIALAESIRSGKPGLTIDSRVATNRSIRIRVRIVRASAVREVSPRYSATAGRAMAIRSSAATLALTDNHPRGTPPYVFRRSLAEVRRTEEQGGCY